MLGGEYNWIITSELKPISARQKHLFGFDQAFIPHGVTNAQLFRDCEPIRLLETPGSLSEYIPITIITTVTIIIESCLNRRPLRAAAPF